MYNGIGLQTTRGTGTSGHIQRNLAAVRRPRPRPTHRQNSRHGNASLIRHEARRKVEVAVAELEEDLVSRGYDKARIAEMADRLRSDLLARDEREKEGERDREIEEGKSRRMRGEQRRQRKGKDGGGKFRVAFGIDREYQEGDFLKRMNKSENQMESTDARDKGGEIAHESLDIAESDTGRMKESIGAQRGMGANKGMPRERSDVMAGSSSSLSSSSSASSLSYRNNEQREKDEQEANDAAVEVKKRRRIGGSDENFRTVKRLRPEDENVFHDDLNFRERLGTTQITDDQFANKLIDQEPEHAEGYRDVVESSKYEMLHQSAQRYDGRKSRMRKERKSERQADDTLMQRTKKVTAGRGSRRSPDSCFHSSGDSSDGVVKSPYELTRPEERKDLSTRDAERNSRFQKPSVAQKCDFHRHRQNPGVSSSESSHSAQRGCHRSYRRRHQRRRSDFRGYSESPRRYRGSGYYYGSDKYYSDDDLSDSESYNSRSPYSRCRRVRGPRKQFRYGDSRSRSWHISEDDEDYSREKRTSARERWDQKQYMKASGYLRQTGFSSPRRHQNYNSRGDSERRFYRNLRRGHDHGRCDNGGLDNEKVYARRDGYSPDDEWKTLHRSRKNGRHRSDSPERCRYNGRCAPDERLRLRRRRRYYADKLEELRVRGYSYASRERHSDRE